LSRSIARVSVLHALMGCRFLRARLLRRSPAAHTQPYHVTRQHNKHGGSLADESTLQTLWHNHTPCLPVPTHRTTPTSPANTAIPG
jgi:hypothetical protein